MRLVIKHTVCLAYFQPSHMLHVACHLFFELNGMNNNGVCRSPLELNSAHRIGIGGTTYYPIISCPHK